MYKILCPRLTKYWRERVPGVPGGVGAYAGITSNFSSRAFSVSAPSTWNSLPAHIRSIGTLSTFKRHLKSHLFQSAFTV